MKNKILKNLLILIFFLVLNIQAKSDEQFNFNITEIEITNNGNFFKGLKKGQITSDNGIIITADEFEYDKLKNILKANGDVTVEDVVKEYTIYTDNIVYLKNSEIINTFGNSKGIDQDGQTITADEFEYDKLKNILKANGDVNIVDEIKDYEISSEKISHFRNEEKIISEGKTESNIKSKYNIKSKNAVYFEKDQILLSDFKTIFNDQNSTIYNLDKFKYFISKEELIGENIVVVSNYGLPKSDTYYFSSAIINLKDNSAFAKDVKIEMHKNIFGNDQNDPRLYGVSSSTKDNITKVKKGIFTSCKKNDKCPPWSISAKEITHNKNKKILTYKNALLKIYKLPIFYMPKFFHPDPTVERQSGFLQPRINDSKLLGSSINTPYYHVISENKDITINPVFFDSGKPRKIKMLQAEFRQQNMNSSFIADFGLTENFKSQSSNKNNNLTHFFSNYDLDLDLKDFSRSSLNVSIEKVSKDNYLKIFDSYMLENRVSPKDFDVLTSEISIDLDKDIYSLDGGLTLYETLNKKNNDKYQYVLPYYNYSSAVYSNDVGKLNLFSHGNNILQNTNNLRTRVINDLNFNSDNFINEKLGLENNFNIHFKNVNTVAKKDNKYKSSWQSELMNIVEMNTSLPTIKETENKTELLTPEVSFRINPGDMKNNSASDRRINTNNIFLIDRLGLEDSLETGKSLTTGVEYRNINNLNDLEFGGKLATVFRDKEEDSIPNNSTIDKKNSYLFGTLDFQNSNIFNLEYNFSIDNKIDEISYHDLDLEFSINNFVTNFNFIEEGNAIGTAHIVESKIKYQFDQSNFLSFKTRRNKEINLTEYYDIIYEYKNDCLVAGLRFNKTYYEDNDLKPTENLMFTISIIPVTNYEQKIDQNIFENGLEN